MRLAKRYTDNPEAYELYLHAQYLWNNKTPENLRRMSEDYDAAIARDPRFALAYVGRAELEISRFGTNRARLDEVLPKIVANLTRALELDDSLAEAHNTLAEIKYQVEFDWTGAEKEFKKAIELNANVATIRLAYGWYLMSAGRFDQAMAEMQRAQELDPRSSAIKRLIGRLFYYSRQYDRAIQHFQLMVDAEPKVAANHGLLTFAYMQKRMYAESVAEFAKAATINGDDFTPEDIESFKETFRKEGWPSYLRWQQARLLRQEKEKYISPFRIAFNYAQLGDKDEAFVWLNKANDARAAGVAGLKIDPGFDALRSDPRFVKALERLNLSP
jgi:adenylate cyclase